MTYIYLDYNDPCLGQLMWRHLVDGTLFNSLLYRTRPDLLEILLISFYPYIFLHISLDDQFGTILILSDLGGPLL